MANAGGATVQLIQLPDPLGQTVPQLGVFYFDLASQLFFSGTRVLAPGEFMQDASSAWVAPGVDVQLVAFDPCTGAPFTLDVVVGSSGLAWDGSGPAMPTTITLASPAQHLFQKTLSRQAMTSGTLEGAFSVDLGNIISSTVGRILQRIVL